MAKAQTVLVLSSELQTELGVSKSVLNFCAVSNARHGEESVTDIPPYILTFANYLGYL